MMCGMRPHTAIIRVYDSAGNVIATHELRRTARLDSHGIAVPQVRQVDGSWKFARVMNFTEKLPSAAPVSHPCE
jgi:hypothetical protein